MRPNSVEKVLCMYTSMLEFSMGGRVKLLFFEEQQQDSLAMAFCEAA